MTVNSLYFLLLLTGIYIFYYAFCPYKYRWMVLLAGSIVFYVAACVASPFYLLAAGVVTWGAGICMERCDVRCREEQKKNPEMDRTMKKQLTAQYKKQKKWIMTAAIVVCLGFLVVLKYGGFLVSITNRVLLFSGWSLPVPKFLVPLGISYYTLIAIGYLFDIYKGKISAQKNFFRLFLFLAFFVQTSQGPISRYQSLGEQLYEGHRYDYQNLSVGCQRMLWGFFKKLVIADRMQPMVKTIFNDYQSYGGITCFLGCIYMTVWMYADFSGYMDIVVGAAKLFGISLEENFKRPFFSKTLAEYWRRWHITLSGWFRDYMFYPLAISSPAVKFGKKGRKWFGTRVGKLFPALFALFFVWFFTGLWHDASIKYVLWGIANGVFIMGAMILEPWFEKWKEFLHIRDDAKGWQYFCTVRTFLLVSFLKIFPGAVTTKAMFGMVGKFITDIRIPSGWEEIFPGLTPENVFFLVLALLLLFVVDTLEEKGNSREHFAGKAFAVRWLCYGVLLIFILCVGSFGLDMKGGFAYAQY